MAFQGRLPEESADAAPPEADPAAITAAHDAVRADRSIQFDLAQPETPDPPPDWLIRLFDWLASMGPLWQILFWVLIAVAVIVLVIALVPPLREWALDRMRRRKAVTEEDAPEWTPEESRARALLADADARAAAGDYDGAVHIILLRSIDDIEVWRGHALVPSLTARDIAAADELPDAARGVFARIAAVVERSIFAGQRLSADDWQAARADYAAFALGRG
ncbi:DUF4129 domain-containing protein [Sphingomonas aestuarii]